MEKLTYQQAYNKIIEAYFKDEIKPNKPNFCFCGTLSNNEDWKKGDSAYSREEYIKMEVALFKSFLNTDWSYFKNDNRFYATVDEYSEDELFKGMCAALEVLKSIHKERGENVDEPTPFTKRQLQLN